MSKKRVVVIGFGVLFLFGNDVDISWNNVINGVFGIGLIICVDVEEYLVKVVVELKDFNVEDYMDKKEVRKMDCFI